MDQKKLVALTAGLTSKPDKSSKETHFWKRFIFLLPHAHPYPRFLSFTGSLWLIVISIAVVAVHAVVTEQYGNIKGNFSKATLDLSQSDLTYAIWHGFLYANLLAIIKSLMYLLQYLIQAQVRSKLIPYLHELYLTPELVYYKLNQFESKPINADQRLTQDTSMFAQDWAEVIWKSIDTPVELVYYTVVFTCIQMW